MSSVASTVLLCLTSIRAPLHQCRNLGYCSTSLTRSNICSGVYGTRALRFTVGKGFSSPSGRPSWRSCFLATILGSLRTHDQEGEKRAELHRTEQEGALRLFHRRPPRSRPRPAGLGGQEHARRQGAAHR